MFCTECGSKIEDDSLFCPNCGTRVAQDSVKEAPAKEAPKAAPVKIAPKAEAAPAKKAPAPKKKVAKESKKYIVISICFAVLAIALIGIGVFILKDYSDKDAEETTQESEKEDRDEDETSVASSEEQPVEVPTESSEESQVASSSEVTYDPEELFAEYADQLLDDTKQLEMGKAYVAPYVAVQESYGPTSQIGADAYGLIKTVVCDMDGDGEKEMLSVGVNQGSMEYFVYELDGTQVRVASGYNGPRKENFVPMFFENDSMKLNVYLHEFDGKYYLIERFDAHRDWGIGYDGSYLGILCYDGANFQSYYGKYCSGTDEASFEASEEDLQALKDVGMTKTASSYWRVGSALSPEDGLEELLCAVAVRSADQVHHDKKAYDDKAGNVADLSGVSYYFFDTEAEYESLDLIQKTAFESNFLTSYEVNRVDHGIASTNELGGIVSYCDHVTFKGDDEELIAWINEQMEDAVKAYDSETIEEDLKAQYEDKKESPYPQEEYSYQPLDFVSVHAEGDYLSVDFQWFWYMGGVTNTGNVGANYNLAEKRSLTLAEVLGMKDDDVLKLVAKKLSESTGDTEKNLRTKLKKYLKDNKDYSFWFDKYNVYLYFDSYSLDQGGWGIEITIDRP